MSRCEEDPAAASRTPATAAAGGDGSNSGGGGDDDELPPRPPRRTSSILRVQTKRKVVKTGLLARIFFPHYHHSATDTVTGESRLTKHRRPSGLAGASTSATTATVDVAAEPSIAREGTYVIDERPIEDEEEVDDSISGRVARFMQSGRVQTFFLILLVLDVFLVIAEILILTFVEIHTELPGPESKAAMDGYVPPANCDSARIVRHVIEGAGRDEPKEYWEITPPGCPIGVYQALSHPLHTAETVLTWFSRVILWMFALELIILLAALRLKFVKHPMYMLDSVIIVVAVVIDAVLWAEHNQEESAIFLLVFVRCWRFARILHGVGMTVHEVDEVHFEEAHLPAAEGAAAGAGDDEAGKKHHDDHDHHHRNVNGGGNGESTTPPAEGDRDDEACVKRAGGDSEDISATKDRPRHTDASNHEPI